MVKENLIPIENKKPFETVYELKNEIPSYEEFMKTYENDANLNYNDLSGGSVVPCPATDCPDVGRGPVYNWVHSTDWGDIKISDCANMKCEKQRKQIKDNKVVRLISGPEDAEECFSIVLLGFVGTMKNKPDFLREEIKKEFYEEVTEGRGEKIIKDVINSKDDLTPGSPEYAEELGSFFSRIQGTLASEREIELSLKGKTYEDIEVESKFGKGSGDKEVQRSTSSGGVSLVPVVYDFYGEIKKEENVLIRKTLRLGDRDYNSAKRELISQPGKVYRVGYFNEKEQAEINAIFPSTPTSQSIRQELVNDILQNIDKWKIEDKVVSHTYNAGKWYRGKPEPVLIRQDAEEIKYDQSTGEIIIQSGKLYRVQEDLTEAEQKAIGYKSEQKLQNSSVSTTQKNNDNSIGKGGIMAIISVASALLIGGLAVVKKQLNKKVKK
ncbi:11705_t:CDS:2 [Ambispora gerdemannii]|uniref:11705_t:CDS:1 n=1 Tax=Ambispora gerdemannii TaxID=144530 RepID=A0A9N9C4Q2_9GLOM|nr:11705_t:CDS:2 [Ambispora gerdemannii]